MISQINNLKNFLFVTVDNSSEHNSVLIDQLWGEDAYLPKQQRMLNQHLKKLKV